MKPATFFLCLVPTIAFAIEAKQIPPAMAPSPSIPNNTPPVPLPAISTRPQDDTEMTLLEAPQMIHLQVADRIPYKPNAVAGSFSGKNTLSLRTLKSTTDLSKSLRARSEGTLGQAPWIGMAIGLTCTAMAAVMLG